MKLILIVSSYLFFLLVISRLMYYTGGAVAQSVEHSTPGQEVQGSIPAVAARSLLVGSVSL